MPPTQAPAAFDTPFPERKKNKQETTNVARTENNDVAINIVKQGKIEPKPKENEMNNDSETR